MNEEVVKKRQLLRPGLRLFNTLTTVNEWHFLWISIVLSEILTSLMGLLLKGSVTYDYLVTGGVVSKGDRLSYLSSRRQLTISD